MSHHMGLEVVFYVECAMTDITLKWFVSRMNSLVVVQCRVLSKGLITLCTLIGTFMCVDTAVDS